MVSSGVGNLVSVMAGMDQDRVLDLKEKVRRSRLQAEQQLRIDEETTTDSDAAAAADPMRTPKVRITHVDTTPATVKRTFSNASAVAGNRPHSWQVLSSFFPPNLGLNQALYLRSFPSKTKLQVEIFFVISICNGVMEGKDCK